MPAVLYPNIRSTTNTQCPFLAREGPSDRTREPKWGMVPFDYESRLEWLRFIVVERACQYRCPRRRPPPPCPIPNHCSLIPAVPPPHPPPNRALHDLSPFLCQPIQPIHNLTDQLVRLLQRLQIRHPPTLWVRRTPSRGQAMVSAGRKPVAGCGCECHRRPPERRQAPQGSVTAAPRAPVMRSPPGLITAGPSVRLAGPHVGVSYSRSVPCLLPSSRFLGRHRARRGPLARLRSLDERHL